jgi:hypothetical protein
MVIYSVQIVEGVVNDASREQHDVGANGFRLIGPAFTPGCARHVVSSAERRAPPSVGGWPEAENKPRPATAA